MGLGRLPGAGVSDPAGTASCFTAATRRAPGQDDAVMHVERVDFVSFLTQDIARAKQFYL